MGGCCSSGTCCANASPKPNKGKDNTKKRPWRRSTNENSSLVGQNGIHSSNEEIVLSHPDDLVIKNRGQEGNSSSEGLARSSSIFVDTEGDEYERTAISQLLIQVTDLLANSANEDLLLELRFSPSTRQSLENEMRQLSEKEQSKQLPTLKRMLQLNPPNSSFSTNTQELHKLESEIFTFLDSHKEEVDLDPYMTLHRCLATRRVRPPYNRFLRLHLCSFLQHPNVQENEDIKQDIQDFLLRLERSPDGIELTTNDASLLLELITMTNAPVFSAVSTPPRIFNQRTSTLIVAAMRIARLSVDLQRLAERREINSETQKGLLEETQSLLTASNNQSCQSARFYSKVIPKRDRQELSNLVSELLRASKDSICYLIPENQAKELSNLSIHLGEVGLTCARFKIAKAHHIVRNRFRLSQTDFQRICVIEKENHQLIRDALLLVNAAAIVRYQDVESLINILDGESDVTLGKEDAACLEHLLTSGIDFQSSRGNELQSPDESTKSLSNLDNREEPILPVDSSVVRNPFALAKTPEPDETSGMVISDFFNNEDENTYENDSLLKPVEANSTLTTTLYRDDFKSSSSDLVSGRRTLPTNDDQFYFKLLGETLILRKSICGMQRSPTQLFAYKLAAFQIIQLCDCVRKLSSVKPNPEDGKLIKKLSTEANRHLKFKLKAKTVGRLRSFYQRIHDPVLQSSSTKLAHIMEEELGTPVDKEACLNAEKTFNQAEICSAILFDSTDSLTLLFLDSIKQRCITSTANMVILSKTEFQNLCALAQEASVILEAVRNQSAPADTPTDKVSQLLCLYKIRALIKNEVGYQSHRLRKRLLWKHALIQFFNHYPEKATKSPFSDGAFNIFVEDSVQLSEDIQQDALQEIQSLIETLERTTNATPEAVSSLLSPKAKRQKLLEALKSKFVVSSANNRQLNCDPMAVGQWISELESCSQNSFASTLEALNVEDIRQFLLTQPETQELNEAALTENLNFFGSDKCLASFEPRELTRVTSITSGIGQTSPRSNLIFILLLEALVKHYNQQKIFINRSVFSELQGLNNDQIEEKIIRGVVNVENSLDNFDQVKIDEDSHIYTSSQQNNLTDKMLGENNINLTPATTETDSDFERNIDSFLCSDNSLLYSIALLNSIHSEMITYKGNPVDHSELILVLSISLNYVPNDSALHEAIKVEIENLRVGSSEIAPAEIRQQMIKQLLVLLGEKLTNDIIMITSECISQLSNHECINDLSLLSSLQFICIGIVLIPVDFEVKLLATLLCRPISTISAETVPLIRAILIEISQKLQSFKESRNVRDLRLMVPLLPLALDPDEDNSTVDFDKLLTTVCVANELAAEIGGSAGSKVNRLLAEIFWTVFFNHEHLTPRGVFGKLYEETFSLTSEWLRTDSQCSSFFSRLYYTSGRFPLNQTRYGKLPPDFKVESFQMESYFYILQSLLVITGLLKHTDSRILLTREHRLTLYHAAMICVSSGHFHGRLEAKVGLIFMLNRIEKFHVVEDGEQVSLNNLLLDAPVIQGLVESAVSEAGRSIVENLRSHIAPVILPLGSDTGDPFMSPDPVLVREGLETSLCGYFSISPSDALSALRILSQLQYGELSKVDLATICRIINYLFKDGDERFKNPSGMESSRCVVDISDDLVQPIAVETAISNLEVFSSIGSLRSTQDVEIFLKSIFVLSSCIGPKNSTDAMISETIVSSPSETCSSFSVRHSSEAEVFQSLESSPILPKISKEPSTEDERTLIVPVQIDVKKLVEKIDRSSDNLTISNLLDFYHHSRLLLQNQKTIKFSVGELIKLVPDLRYILPSNEQVLTESQTQFLKEISYECHHRISVLFKEVLWHHKPELSVRLLHGYFSLMLPIASTTPVVAQGLMSLRIAQIQMSISQKDLWTYVESNLQRDPTTIGCETIILAIQGVQKALDGFTLNTVEQICLLYALSKEDEFLFADLAAFIHWMDIWPVKLMQKQREYLKDTLNQWTRSISHSNTPSKVGSLNLHDAYQWTAVGMSTNWSTEEGLKLIDSFPESVDDPEMHQLRESMELSIQNLDNDVSFLKMQLSANTLDEFTTLSSTLALSIIRSLRRISTNTDWFSSIQDTISQSCKRLYLAVACNSLTGDKEAEIHLPRKYLNFQSILSILISQHPRVVCSLDEQIAISPPEVQTLCFKSRPKGVRSMEVISGSLRSLRSWRFNNGSLYDDLDTLSRSTPFKRSSLDKLQELIEIRRAVIAGSRSQLSQLCYGFPLAEIETSKQKKRRAPDKLDLIMLRRRCKEHTKRLIQRATYEQKQAELYCRLMHQNLKLTSQTT